MTNLRFISERVFENWRTSILSVLIMVPMCGALYFDKVTWAEWTLSMGVAIGFLFFKDPGAKGRALRKSKREFEKAIDDHEEAGS